MKKISLWVVLIVGLITFGPAISGGGFQCAEDVCYIDPGEITFETKKGNVKFDHQKHTESLQCTDCHHTTKADETFKPCRECHTKRFNKAFHDKKSVHSCVGCHKKEGKGPQHTPCKNCHKK